MIKIGILTFHNNENKGVVLQAFALQGRLSNHFNCDADVVEYRTKSKERSRKVKYMLQILSRSQEHIKTRKS